MLVRPELPKIDTTFKHSSGEVVETLAPVGAIFCERTTGYKGAAQAATLGLLSFKRGSRRCGRPLGGGNPPKRPFRRSYSYSITKKKKKVNIEDCWKGDG